MSLDKHWSQTALSSAKFYDTTVCLFCDLLGLRGRPSLDTLRGIAAELRSPKSEGGALIRVPPVPAVRV